VSYILALQCATVGYLLLRDYATHRWSLCHIRAEIGSVLITVIFHHDHYDSSW